MGCNSSSDAIIKKMKEQEKKIDEVIQLNMAFDKRVKDLQSEIQDASNKKKSEEYQEDLTNLKQNLDSRFDKIEKTVGYLEQILTKKLKKDDNNNSLSLSISRVNINNKVNTVVQNKNETDWNELLDASKSFAKKNIKTDQEMQAQNQQQEIKEIPIGGGTVHLDEIKMEFTQTDGTNRNTIKTEFEKSKKMLTTLNGKDILEDDMIKQTLEEVKSKLAKNQKEN